MKRFFVNGFTVICLVFFAQNVYTFSSDWDDWWENGELPGLQTLTDWLWSKDYLTSKITVRLVKKSWKLEGVAYDDYVDEFPGQVEEAYAILRATREYPYIEKPLARSVELFTETRDDSETETEYDKTKDSIIIIHPFLSSADEGFFTKPTLTTLAMRNIHRRYNLFLYDMPQLNLNFFFTIVREAIGYQTRYEDMAEVLCAFILDGVKAGHWVPSQIHLIGYSYSANLAGYMARWVKFITKIRINTIMCLDPFSAQYNEYLIHVNRNDAEVVHSLHTSSYVSGTRERVATADFVFNDGFIQPECVGIRHYLDKILSFKITAPEPFTCSHFRVTPRFWYVILYPSKFQARQCETWPLFRNCICEEKEQSIISYPIVNRNARGTYFLRTLHTKPYGLGEKGSHCFSVKESGENL